MGICCGRCKEEVNEIKIRRRTESIRKLDLPVMKDDKDYDIWHRKNSDMELAQLAESHELENRFSPKGVQLSIDDRMTYDINLRRMASSNAEDLHLTDISSLSSPHDTESLASPVTSRSSKSN